MSESRTGPDGDQDEASLGWRRAPEEATELTWLFALVAVLAYAAVGVSSALDAGKGGAETFGALLGAILVPLLVVGIFSIPERFRTQRARVRIFGIAAAVLSLLSVAPRLMVPSMYRGSGQPWEHRMEAEGVTLRLPSQRWTVAAKKVHLVDFASAPGMVAGVSAVEAVTADGFAAAVEQFKSRVRDRRDIEGSKVEQGVTAAGDSLVISTFREKVPGASTPIFVALARVWLKGTQKMVTLIFEGHPTMWGRDAQTVELEEMSKAAREIFLSVHG